jgi:hypothetical protein
MNFSETLARVRATPTAFLDTPCVLSLQAFLQGYMSADGSAFDIMRASVDAFPGPAQADVCTRAYLYYPDGVIAMCAVIDEMERLLSTGNVQPERGHLCDVSFVESVRQPILDGHAAMVVGSDKVVSFYNYVRGFLCGLEAVAPLEAARQGQQLADFERWLQVYEKCPRAAWYKLVRIFGGERDRGLRKFIEWWDEFQDQRDSG